MSITSVTTTGINPDLCSTWSPSTTSVWLPQGQQPLWSSSGVITLRKVENGWILNKNGKEYVFLDVESMIPTIKE